MLIGCTGLIQMFRMAFVLTLYPIPWFNKFYLYFLTFVILFLAANIHFILLIPIAYHFPEWYSFVHDWPTRIIYFSSYFICWLVWEKSIKSEKAVSNS